MEHMTKPIATLVNASLHYCFFCVFAISLKCASKAYVESARLYYNDALGQDLSFWISSKVKRYINLIFGAYLYFPHTFTMNQKKAAAKRKKVHLKVHSLNTWTSEFLHYYKFVKFAFIRKL